VPKRDARKRRIKKKKKLLINPKCNNFRRTWRIG